MAGWGGRKRFGLGAGATVSRDKVVENKYHNKKSEYLGIKFDSLMELKTYKKLLELKDKGYIKDVEAHPDPIELIPSSSVSIKEFDKRSNTYKSKDRVLFNSTVFNPDFKIVLNNNKVCYYDTKTFATLSDSYSIKVKLLYQLKGLICVTGFPIYDENMSIILKAVEKNMFLQYFNKNSCAKYIDDLKAGRFGSLN